jgi:phenylpyruvate tautomerase PptA (4-oxalocrotonate tautomerase family)
LPIITFHLIENTFTDEQQARLLTEGSRIFAEVLDTPIDRTRAFINLCPPGRAAVGGVIVEEGSTGAPFFVFFLSAHRPRDFRTLLLARLTDLIEDTLGVDRSLIRGYAQITDPDSWAVAGVPLSAARAAEMHDSVRPEAEAVGLSRRRWQGTLGSRRRRNRAAVLLSYGNSDNAPARARPTGSERQEEL